MDGMASSGVRFARTYAHNVVALPSHANILSGLYPIAHGVHDDSGFRFPSNIETAATLLSARGFSCGAFVGAYPLDSRFGLNIGFEIYDDHFGDTTEVQEFQSAERRAGDVAKPFLQWLDTKQPGAKWFAWVNFYDPHAPYDPIEPYRTQFTSHPYDGEIAYVDSQVARILAQLKQKGLDASTCIILTSDHGEGLGEHNEPTHGIFAYESTLRVPLIIKGPGMEARTIQTAVQHIDLLPTMLELIGGTVPGTLKGKSLKPLLDGAAEDSTTRDSYFEANSANLNMNWAPLTGIISGTNKYIDLPIPELYDIAKDPGEKENLFQKKPDVSADLKKRLSSLVTAAGSGSIGSQDQEALERLQSLGYVSSGASAAKSSPTYTTNDDPKNLIGMDSMIENARAAASAGDLEKAKLLFSDLIIKRPGTSIAYGELAMVYRQLGQPQKGIELLERALKDGHGIPGLLAKLGLCYSDAGKSARAIEILEQAAKESDDTIDALTWLGMAYSKAGQPDRAIATFEKILVDDPKNPAAYACIGTVSVGKKDHAHAIEAFKTALQIDPAQFNAMYQLATLYQRTGRATEARPYIEQFVQTAPPAHYKREIEQLKTLLQKGP